MGHRVKGVHGGDKNIGRKSTSQTGDNQNELGDKKTRLGLNVSIKDFVAVH